MSMIINPYSFGGGAALWSPLNMAVVPKIHLDMQDSVITNVSGEASAIANLGSAGAAGDFVQATAANRPTIMAAALNGNRILRFDSTQSDRMTSGLRSLYRNSNAAWVFVVYAKRNTDSSGTPTRYLFATPNSSGGFRLGTTAGSGTDYNKPKIFATRLDADSTVTLSSPNARSISYAMSLSLVDFQTRACELHVNGSVDTSNATLIPTAGATSDTDASADLSIGATATGVGPSDVDIAAVVAGNVAPSAGDIDKLFGWAAHKYDLTASLPPGHPYKTVAPTV